MKSTRRATALALVGALAATALAACSSSGSGERDRRVRRRARSPSRSSRLQPGSEPEAIDAFNEQVAQFEDANPDIDVEPEEYTWTATDVRRPARRRHPARRLRDPVHRRQDPHREQARSPTSTTQFRTLPYADKFNPAIARGRDGPRRARLRHPGQVRLRRRPALQPDPLRAGRARPRQAADDLGRGPRVRQDDRRREPRRRRLRPDDPEQHRRLAAHRRRPTRAADASRRSATTARPPSARQRRPPRKPSSSSRTCAGRTTRWAATSCSTGAPSTRPSPPASRHVHLGLRRLHLAGPEQRARPRRLRPHRPPARRRRRRRPRRAARSPRCPSRPPTTRRPPPSSGSTSSTCSSSSTRTPRSRTPRRSSRATSPSASRCSRSSTRSSTWSTRSGSRTTSTSRSSQMTGFTDIMFDQPLVGEPSQTTQEIYALLDPVVQAVLTDQNADIDALLADANTQAQALLDQGDAAERARLRTGLAPAAPGRRQPSLGPAPLAGHPARRATPSTVTAPRCEDTRPPPPTTRPDRRSPVDRDLDATAQPRRLRRRSARDLGARRRSQHPGLPAADARDLRRVLLVPDRARGRDERPGDEPRRRPGFVGLDNFRYVLADPLLWTAVQNTAVLRVPRARLRLPDPARRRGAHERGAAVARASTRALAYLPVVVPPVVAVLLWKFFYDGSPDGRVQHDPRLGRASARTRGSRTRRPRCRRSCSRRPGPRPAGR